MIEKEKELLPTSKTFSHRDTADSILRRLTAPRRRGSNKKKATLAHKEHIKIVIK